MLDFGYYLSLCVALLLLTLVSVFSGIDKRKQYLEAENAKTAKNIFKHFFYTIKEMLHDFFKSYLFSLFLLVIFIVSIVDEDKVAVLIVFGEKFNILAILIVALVFVREYLEKKDFFFLLSVVADTCTFIFSWLLSFLLIFDLTVSRVNPIGNSLLLVICVFLLCFSGWLTINDMKSYFNIGNSETDKEHKKKISDTETVLNIAVASVSLIQTLITAFMFLFKYIFK